MVTVSDKWLVKIGKVLNLYNMIQERNQNFYYGIIIIFYY